MTLINGAQLGAGTLVQ